MVVIGVIAVDAQIVLHPSTMRTRRYQRKRPEIKAPTASDSPAPFLFHRLGSRTRHASKTPNATSKVLITINALPQYLRPRHPDYLLSHLQLLYPLLPQHLLPSLRSSSGKVLSAALSIEPCCRPSAAADNFPPCFRSGRTPETPALRTGSTREARAARSLRAPAHDGAMGPLHVISGRIRR
jgi:hypothetical protein